MDETMVNPTSHKTPEAIRNKNKSVMDQSARVSSVIVAAAMYLFD
jgi:hypothetical protein